MAERYVLDTSAILTFTDNYVADADRPKTISPIRDELALGMHHAVRSEKRIE